MYLKSVVPSVLFLILSSSLFPFIFHRSLLFPPSPAPPAPPLCTVSVYVNPILVQLCCAFKNKPVSTVYQVHKSRDLFN